MRRPARSPRPEEPRPTAFGHSSAPPAFEDGDRVDVVAETPAGSRRKHDDHATGLYRREPDLPDGMRAHSFGLVPNALAEDGDPADVILLDGAAPTGTVVTARPVGVLEARRTEGGHTSRDGRVIAAADPSRAHAEIRDLAGLRSGLMEEVEAFFAAHDELMGRRFEPAGRGDANEAPAPLRAAERAGG